MKLCYFKRLSNSISQEGINYLEQFKLNYRKCKPCTGYPDYYGGCKNYVDLDSKGGLERMMEMRK